MDLLTCVLWSYSPGGGHCGIVGRYKLEEYLTTHLIMSSHLHQSHILSPVKTVISLRHCATLRLSDCQTVNSLKLSGQGQRISY